MPKLNWPLLLGTLPMDDRIARYETIGDPQNAERLEVMQWKTLSSVSW